MATYATVADFEAYVPGWNTTDAAALEEFLVQAERDVDQELGYPLTDTGIPYLAPADVPSFVATALKRATCAQAYYLMVNGGVGFVHAPRTRVEGPDFSGDPLPRFSPQALRELKHSGLLRLTARMTSRRRVHRLRWFW